MHFSHYQTGGVVKKNSFFYINTKLSLTISHNVMAASSAYYYVRIDLSCKVIKMLWGQFRNFCTQQQPPRRATASIDLSLFLLWCIVMKFLVLSTLPAFGHWSRCVTRPECLLSLRFLQVMQASREGESFSYVPVVGEDMTR